MIGDLGDMMFIAGNAELRPIVPVYWPAMNFASPLMGATNAVARLAPKTATRSSASALPIALNLDVRDLPKMPIMSPYEHPHVHH